MLVAVVGVAAGALLADPSRITGCGSIVVALAVAAFKRYRRYSRRPWNRRDGGCAAAAAAAAVAAAAGAAGGVRKHACCHISGFVDLGICL